MHKGSLKNPTFKMLGIAESMKGCAGGGRDAYPNIFIFERKLVKSLPFYHS